MDDDAERPGIGPLPKVLVGALALFGVITLISWVTSWLFGLLRLGILVVVIVVVVLWVGGHLRRQRRGPSGRDDETIGG